MSTKKIHDVKKILQRAKLVCNKESDQELADFLGVKKQTLGAWKNRNSQKAIEKISEAIHGSELVFVLTGETEKPPLVEAAQKIGIKEQIVLDIYREIPNDKKDEAIKRLSELIEDPDA